MAALLGGTTAIFASDEYRQHLVESMYEHFLDRPSDPGGLAAWTGQLKIGGTDFELIAGMTDTTSQEFFNKTAP